MKTSETRIPPPHSILRRVAETVLEVWDHWPAMRIRKQNAGPLMHVWISLKRNDACIASEAVTLNVRECSSARLNLPRENIIAAARRVAARLNLTVTEERLP